MHIVYLIIDHDRKAKGLLPYMYVGSKRNCSYRDFIIYDSRGREYWGSSRYKGWVPSSLTCRAYVLFSSEDMSPLEILDKEKECHKELEVRKDPSYFNQVTATVNSFTNGLSTYVHKDHPEKKTRTTPQDPLVLDGTFLHVNKGRKRSAKNIKWFVENVAKRSKSEEHKKKIGRSGHRMLHKAGSPSLRLKPESSEYRKAIEDGYSTRKNQPDPIKECEKCGLKAQASSIARFHNDLCTQEGSYKSPSAPKTSRRIVPVVINGVSYRSIRQAEIDLGITRTQVRNRNESNFSKASRQKKSS